MSDLFVSATEPDWSRERLPAVAWAPSLRLIQAIRRYQYWRARRGPWALLMRHLNRLRHGFWSIVTGAELPLTGLLGGGLILPHPNGVVIHPKVMIGVNCMIFQQVTLGHGGPIPGVPTLGGHVDVGAGAKILGGVWIGDHARIGANAVVLTNVPPYATAVGVPARIISAAGTSVLPKFSPNPV